MKRCRPVKRPVDTGITGTLLAAAILTLAACASEPPTEARPLNYLEKDAVNALSLNLDKAARMSLSRALDQYEADDDLEGQWRIRYRLALLDIREGRSDDLRSGLEALQEIARQIDSAAVSFRTLLLAGQASGDEHYYRQASAVARDPVEKAVVLTYLGRTGEAVELLRGAKQIAPSDRAFIYYQHGLATGEPSWFRYALDAYRQAGDSRGTADSLMRLALSEKESGHPEQAVILARRAARTLAASGDGIRVGIINAWISSQ